MAVLIVFPSNSQTSVGKLKTSSKHTFFPITRRDHHPDDIVKPAVPVYFTVRSPSTLVYIFLSDIVLLTRLINTVKETSKDRHTTMDYVMRTPITSLEYRTMYIYFPIWCWQWIDVVRSDIQRKERVICALVKCLTKEADRVEEGRPKTKWRFHEDCTLASYSAENGIICVPHFHSSIR